MLETSGRSWYVVRVYIWRRTRSNLGPKFVYKSVYNPIISVTHTTFGVFVLFLECYILVFYCPSNSTLSIPIGRIILEIIANGQLYDICHILKVFGKAFCFWLNANEETCFAFQVLCYNQTNKIYLQHYKIHKTNLKTLLSITYANKFYSLR